MEKHDEDDKEFRLANRTKNGYNMIQPIIVNVDIVLTLRCLPTSACPPH